MLKPGRREGHTFCQACGYLRSFHQMALPVNGSHDVEGEKDSELGE